MTPLKRSLISSVVGSVAIAAAVVGLAVFGPPAQAQVAAKVESQTRPNFGVLLDPPTRGVRQHRRWNYGSHRRGWAPPLRPLPIGGEEVVLIDCGGNPGTGAVEDAVRRVRPGGTLIIRARGGACVGWLNIDKPMNVIGDAGFDIQGWDHIQGATLQAPDGFPCVTVAQGVRVEFRDVVFASPHGGEAACIVNYGGEVVLNRVGFRHAGDEAAIFADGGLIDIRSARIDADTISAAIVADGATLLTDEVLIARAQSGIELTTGSGPVSRINRTRLLGPDRPNTFGPRAIGLLVKAGRNYDEVAVTNSKICGYPEGVAVEGAVVRLDHTRICKADRAVVVYNGEVGVDSSRLVATDTGVLVTAGHARINDSIFAGMYSPVSNGPRGSITADRNQLWSGGGDPCAPQFSPRYGNRYAPSWGGGGGGIPGFTCAGEPYPRDWWQQDEADLNVPYSARLAYPDNYDRYSQGQGWYDCHGRYVDNDRYGGNDRWNRGSAGWTRDCPRRPGEPLIGAYGNLSVGAFVGPANIDFNHGFAFGL